MTMQIPELAAKLQSVGFSDKQAKVYVAGLFLGASAVQKIAEQADINRATTYVILDELKNMGLVNESTKGKKTVFVTEPPEAIEKLLESQKAILDTKKTELRDLLPNLKEVSRSSDSNDAPVVRFYKGEKGIKETRATYLRKAQAKSEIYSLINLDELEKTLPGLLEKDIELRVKKRVSSKIFYSSDNEDLRYSREQLVESKDVAIPAQADVTLYDNVAIITTYREKHTLIIENKAIVATLRQLFALAWSK